MRTDKEGSIETAVVYWSVGRIQDMMPCPDRDGKEAGMGGEHAQGNKVEG